MRKICQFCIFLCFLSFAVSAGAASLTDAVVSLFDQVEQNLYSNGQIVSIIKEKNEAILEFADGTIPGAGAEFLVYDAGTEDQKNTEKAFNRIFKGVVSVVESAGSVSRALIVRQEKTLVVGDQVMIPVPIMAYVAPVKNMTGFPPLIREATEVISLQLGRFSTMKIAGIPQVNQILLDQLQNELRREGRYGLIIQPYLIVVNGQSKAQLKLISLFSGQSLGVLSEDFFAFPGQGSAQPAVQNIPPASPYPGQYPPPNLPTRMPSVR
ncbi:MAG: hypothetical protein GWP07_05360 [Xanthomonadaceae bacterium]|nr:hypothetical protein [Xanthomonadaceae bacterium]